ncbi:hypothetical protein BEL04_23025 [Mucilaginibacter sp. PPCGB 2223]|uniref:PAS domain S-box protein n=1 Tax=Mucilaginibacter sp. PPCGB 2223 TaxID=1886027 RepID=UPI0008267F86|nr:PAS domain S-box protein [Mucilaginibacter sp. PPCGB 2223]OCX50645.1 hypothetical protein BEL04_23025 [Mucilaginibacter sp. PPCGB 2223]
MRPVAFRIVLMYGLAGVSWIAISDALFYQIHSSKDVPLLCMGTVSALLFVLITCFILYRLIQRYYKRLRLSEKQYRTYFDDNPIPMWIYDRETLLFIAVNDAAVLKYGYSKEEFYNMSILDIRPPEDAGKVMEAVSDRLEKPDYKNFGVWRHRRKDGSDIFAHITSHLTHTNNEQHVMIAAEDVTQRLLTEERLQQANTELLRQNNLLREISWAQSHNVRRPLASILGLLNVIRISDDASERELCINYIEISASELDIMVYEINEQINQGVYHETPDLKPKNPVSAGLLY